MEPICTRVTPESLPGLLERLEAETGVMWFEHCNDVRKLKPTEFMHRVVGCYIIFRDLALLQGYKGANRYDDYEEMDDPNEFIRRVSAACPKEGGR